jgi:hypothetical protein
LERRDYRIIVARGHVDALFSRPTSHLEDLTMPRCWPRVVVVTLCCLPVSAASARADCAWVLWVQTTKVSNKGSVQSETSPDAAYETRQACQGVLDRSLASWKSAPNSKVTDRAVYLPNTEILYVCLPETVDPRGPKGK